MMNETKAAAANLDLVATPYVAGIHMSCVCCDALTRNAVRVTDHDGWIVTELSMCSTTLVSTFNAHNIIRDSLISSGKLAALGTLTLEWRTR